MTFTSFFYVCLSFLRLDDQTRLPFGPDYCLHYCISLLGRYLPIIFSSPPLALAFDVCLPGFMLIAAAPADLVLGLTLTVATSELLLVLNAGWFSLKPYNLADYISTLFLPHYILII